MSCPCGTKLSYENCCGPLHRGEAANGAEALMRSRYSAFVQKEFDYIDRTTDPQARNPLDRQANERWAQEAEFTRLEILSAREEGNKGFVEFKAYFRMGGEDHVHHEKSLFRKQSGIWYFRDGKVQEPKKS